MPKFCCYESVTLARSINRMEKTIENPQTLRRGLPYFLLFSIYAIINTYLPIMLRSLGFSASDIGILLGIIEIAGVCVPLFIIPQLDKTGRYGLMMCIFGLDIAFLLLPMLRFHSFIITAVCLGIFAVGFKGLVPVLDGFTTKALGTHSTQYGKIRALGSVGFVGINVFLQLHPLISGKKPVSVILGISTVALLFVITLRQVPDLYHSAALRTEEEALKKMFQKNISKQEVSESTLVNAKSTVAFPVLFWECLLLILLAFLGLVPCQRFFSLYVEEYVKREASAGLWALSALAEIPLLIVSGKLIQRFGKERLLAVCLFSIVVRNLCYIFIPGIGGAIAGQLLHSISFGLFHPLSVVLCASHSCGRTVTAMTFFTTANGIANIVGSVIGGYIIEYAGYPALFLFFSIFPIIGLGVYFLFVRRL